VSPCSSKGVIYVAETAVSASFPDQERQDRVPVLVATGLSKHFRVRSRGRGRSRVGAVVQAVDDVTLALYPGEVTALVGESGSGKSTVARLLACLYKPTRGTVALDGVPVLRRRGRSFRAHVRQVQLIFQDPFSAVNPLHRIGYYLARPLRVHGYARGRRSVTVQAAKLLEQVQLSNPEQYMDKFPHEVSGGQLQRIAIARALAVRPKVLLADEPVSMLDVSIRLGILNLLLGLAEDLRLAVLYITHDIASARHYAKTTLVMYAGELVESGPSRDVCLEPAHPYTQLLVSAAPNPRRVRHDQAAKDRGEMVSLIDPPAGCRFHPRCPHAMPVCSERSPARSALGEGHWVRCWLYADPHE
jgi:peptide/nickel transport system ATP-binding protein